jgi:hypothetical protein
MFYNIKHIVPFIDDSSEEDTKSRANSPQPGEDDVDLVLGNHSREMLKWNHLGG